MYYRNLSGLVGQFLYPFTKALLAVLEREGAAELPARPVPRRRGRRPVTPTCDTQVPVTPDRSSGSASPSSKRALPRLRRAPSCACDGRGPLVTRPRWHQSRESEISRPSIEHRRL